MMIISEKVAKYKKCGALITGESLGQVASQTMEAIGVTESFTDMAVLRPVIGMDKVEIIEIAHKIDTFETSILPYEDCCTVFTPRHPRTKPKEFAVRAQLSKLDVEGLIERAMAGIEEEIITPSAY
jgi:thiamine biosynthesis protein ThiI